MVLLHPGHGNMPEGARAQSAAMHGAQKRGEEYTNCEPGPVCTLLMHARSSARRRRNERKPQLRGSAAHTQRSALRRCTGASPGTPLASTQWQLPPRQLDNFTFCAVSA
eukprot:6214638-Pleurochrysis_carterae.AAC.3